MKSIFIAGLLMATSVFSAAVPVTAPPEAPAGVASDAPDATRDSVEKPSVLEIPALADDINTRFAAITEALKQAAAQSKSQREAARAVVVVRQDNGTDTGDEGEDGDKCDAACITAKVLDIVQEVASTIRSIIEKFGLGPFLLRINPLLLALSALVIGLDVLVSGLLLTVTAVVNVILGGLGLSLLALGFAAA
ncbi:hypothetical protein PG999_010443 [Apiospora kogelbergensis]|uniref:Uncharacterized protein n=1 Tax=Apiospora kogelbergensis TaxID=1337665 RepID=A0AAW0QL50_9PEZI